LPLQEPLDFAREQSEQLRRDAGWFRTNPLHKRAQLVELTNRGRELFERSMALQRPWAASLGRDLTASQVSEVCVTLDALLVALERTAVAEREPIGAVP
jgi:hypothetical protein